MQVGYETNLAVANRSRVSWAHESNNSTEMTYIGNQVIENGTIVKDWVRFPVAFIATSGILAVSEKFSVKQWREREIRLAVIGGHRKWHHVIDRVRVPVVGVS